MRPRPGRILDYHEFPVLYVDDEADNLRIFELTFRREFAIMTATTGEEALEHARASDPLDPGLTSEWPEGFGAGDQVTVMPVDYGRIPVAGKLVAWTPDEIVVARETAETGPLYNHFPSAGFEVAKA